MNLISDSLICEIVTASHIIIDKTTSEDQLVFIGQSPDYLSYLVGQSRKVVRVPMSGRIYCDQWTIPTQDALRGIFNLLDNYELKPNKIILIDHSHSGKSISGFAKLLNRYFGFIGCENTQWNWNYQAFRFKFINLVSPEQINGWIVKPDLAFVQTIGFVCMPGLVDLANEKYPRTIKMFQYWLWGTKSHVSTQTNDCDINYNILCDKINEFIEKFQPQTDALVYWRTHITFAGDTNRKKY